MPLFRKKPVVIEAWQFALPADRAPEFINLALREGRIYYQGGAAPYFTIPTLEGDMRATIGDWIIKGVAGELYPCKHEIFAATYEQA